jgi:periplasmic protein TonB
MFLELGGIVSRRTWVGVATVLIAAVGGLAIYAGAQAGQSSGTSPQASDIYRRAKIKVQPEYPELARKMELAGVVKIEVTVAPNGTVKAARVVGGHPVLAGAALDAARKWRFEPAPAESSGVIEFKFEAQH